MIDPLTLTVASAVPALVMTVAVRPLLLCLPEPEAPDGKTPYRRLATPTVALTCAALTLVAQTVGVITVAHSVLPLWTVLATAGVLLAAIDSLTTWLPLTLTRAAWGLMVGAVLWSVALGAGWSDVLRTLAGAAVAGGLYLFVWAVTRGGFGFGDVRFAPLVGAATASQSWTLLLWGLTLGTVAGAVHGASRLIRRRPGGFAYAPSMLSGGYLAALALHLLRTAAS